MGGAVVGDEAFVVEAGFSGEEVFAEFLTEFEGDVGDGAFAAREAEEVLEGAAGIIPRFVGYDFSTHFLFYAFPVENQPFNSFQRLIDGHLIDKDLIYQYFFLFSFFLPYLIVRLFPE